MIGVEVFGRSPGWDPQADSTVRMQAARLREKLREYYATEGLADPVVIEIPKGTYVPGWRPVAPARPPWPRWIMAVAGLLLALGGVAAWRMAVPRAIRSVAVLPLRSLDGNVDSGPLVDGLTEDLIRNLAAMPNLRVVSATSSFALRGTSKPLREIGALLDVDAVVEGSVRRDGGRTKVEAKLIRTADDRVLWAGAFERELRDLFGLQEEVASAVAQTLRPNLEKTVSAATAMDPEAYQLYLRGLAAWRQSTKASLSEAIRYFERAAERDPRSARPWPALAAAYMRMESVGQMAKREVRDKTRMAVLRALEIDARSAEAHAALGVVKWGSDQDWKSAQAEFTRAIELNPNSSIAWDLYSLALRSSNRLTEALDAGLRAERLDPLSPEAGEHLAWVYFVRRNYDETLAQCHRVLERHPEYHRIYNPLAKAYLAKGMCTEAIQVIRRPGYAGRGFRGYALARCGQEEEARQLLGRLEQEAAGGANDRVAVAVARIHLGLGDKQRALDWLERASRTGRRLEVLLDPMWDPLLDDPRCKVLRQAVGLAK